VVLSEESLEKLKLIENLVAEKKYRLMLGITSTQMQARQRRRGVKLIAYY